MTSAELRVSRRPGRRLRRVGPEDPTGLLQWTAVFLLAFPSRFVVAGPLRSAGSPSVLLGLLALLLYCLARLRPRGRALPRANPARTGILLFLVLCLASYGWAQGRGLNQIEGSGADRFLLLIASITGLGLLIAEGVPNRQRLEDFLHVLVCAGYVSALIGVGQFLLRFDVAAHVSLPGFVLNGDLFDLDRGGLRRANGTALHAIEFGVVLGALLPLALHLSRYASSEARRRLHTAGIALLFLAGPMSVARSGIISLVVAIVAYAFVWPLRRQVNGVVVAFAGVVLLRVFVHGLTSTLKSFVLNASSDPSIAGRTKDYADVNKLVLEHPWFGRGVGTFRPTAYFTLDNQYLVTYVEGGVVLLLALLAFYLLGAATSRQVWRFGATQADRDLGQAVAASILVLAVAGAFFDEFSFRQAVTLLWVLLGLSGALWRLAPRTSEEKGNRCAV